jgi:regulator of protease activity HflC (stomatin/prohibitin superfamily)
MPIQPLYQSGASNPSVPSAPAQTNVSGVQFIIWLLVAGVGSGLSTKILGPRDMGWGIFASIVLAFIIAAAVRIANEWERVTVLRLGKFVGMKGPGMFFIVPVFETTPFTVDLRVVTYEVPRQKSLSKDNIPVTVDAIVYYQVERPTDAVLKVQNYHAATQLGAQTILRDLIGKAMLDQLLSEREELAVRLREALDNLTRDWGIKVSNVEMKEVIISEALEDAISREPAAEREKRARLKLAEAEKLAAQTFVDAANVYERDPIALQLRAMNMLYEMCMEGKATMVFVPTETRMGMPAPLGVMGITEKLMEAAHKGDNVPDVLPKGTRKPEASSEDEGEDATGL